ncbi:MAG: hypothetical protein H6728_11575 [Myxococcales bacterium]|nr:hypothetical protein [Myxococcales bacterium]
MTGIRSLSSLRILWALVFWWGWGGVAHAQLLSFQDFILGQRALGMGGAFTAVADDPTASFYNPAGLSQLKRLQLEVSLPVYGLEYRVRHKGLKLFNSDASTDIRHLTLTSIPASIGIATLFGPKDKSGRPVWGAGLSILVPWQSKEHFEEGLDAGTAGQVMYLLQREQQVLLIGPSISRRFGTLSLGVSLYYAHQLFNWTLSQGGTEGSCKQNVCQSNEAYSLISTLNAVSGSLQVRLGLLWEINPAWRVGLMASLSSFRLFGLGTFRLQRHRFVVAQNSTESQLVEKENIGAFPPLPWEIRIGTAFRPNAKMLFGLDVSMYLPQEFDILDPTQMNAQDVELFAYPNRIRRNFIVNVNVGAEFKVTPTIPLRFGFYTNLTSAGRVQAGLVDPTISIDPATQGCNAKACVPYINTLGFTTSVGLKVGRGAVNLGLNVAYGFGYVQRSRVSSSQPYDWIPTDQVSVYLYVSGAVQALGFSFLELFKAMQKDPVLKRLFEGDKSSTSLPASRKKKGKRTKSKSSQPKPRKE